MISRFNFIFCTILLLILLHINSSSGLTDECEAHTSCDKCIEHKCGWCYSDRTCHEISTKALCKTQLHVDSCPHFFNRDLIIGSVLCFVGGILSAGGGVGGGPIYIPILVLVLQLTPHLAVPISKVTIFGVAVGGFIILSRRRHPKADRPLIDYDTAFLVEPMTLLGSIIGVYMNLIFPAYALIILLALLLSYNGYKTLNKGWSLYQKEISPEKELNTVPQKEEESSLLENEINAIPNDYLEKDKKMPYWQFIGLALLEGTMLVLMLLKGGGSDSVIGVKCGTWEYWIVVCSAAPLLGGFTYFASKYVNTKYESKVKSGFKFLKEDVHWTKKRSTWLPFLFIFAGICAGFLGIGAGLIVGPIFLEMNMLPQVAVATSSYMILFTSFSTAVQFLILGRLPWDYAGWFFMIGLIAAMIGQVGLAEI